MKSFIATVLFIAFGLIARNVNAQKAIDLSQDMLASFKMNQPTAEYEKELENIPFQALVDELNTDPKKQVFWLNMYIVSSQKLLSSTENGECNNKCKKKKIIKIAGRMFSLNDMLYLILLHSKCTISKHQKMYAPKWEKMLRVNYYDGRVLLAIDSDTDIANEFTYFEPDSIDHQLNVLSLMFINKYVYYNKDTNEIFIPKWLKNFKRELGKKTGIYTGLEKAKVIPEGSKPKIIYSDKIATFK